jgi:hypothetical protein
LQRDHLAGEQSDAHGEIVWFWHLCADAKSAAIDERAGKGGARSKLGRVCAARAWKFVLEPFTPTTDRQE